MKNISYMEEYIIDRLKIYCDCDEKIESVLSRELDTAKRNGYVVDLKSLTDMFYEVIDHNYEKLMRQHVSLFFYLVTKNEIACQKIIDFILLSDGYHYELLLIVTHFKNKKNLNWSMILEKTLNDYNFSRILSSAIEYLDYEQLCYVLLNSPSHHQNVFEKLVNLERYELLETFIRNNMFSFNTNTWFWVEHYSLLFNDIIIAFIREKYPRMQIMWKSATYNKTTLHKIYFSDLFANVVIRVDIIYRVLGKCSETIEFIKNAQERGHFTDRNIHLTKEFLHDSDLINYLYFNTKSQFTVEIDIIYDYYLLSIISKMYPRVLINLPDNARDFHSYCITNDVESIKIFFSNIIKNCGFNKLLRVYIPELSKKLNGRPHVGEYDAYCTVVKLIEIVQYSGVKVHVYVERFLNVVSLLERHGLSYNIS